MTCCAFHIFIMKRGKAIIICFVAGVEMVPMLVAVTSSLLLSTMHTQLVCGNGVLINRLMRCSLLSHIGSVALWP